MGKEVSILFTKEGAKVVGVARREEKLLEVQKEIEAFGGEFIPVPGDMTVDSDVNKVFDVTLDKYGQIDVLVNNAGLLDNQTPVGEVTDELWDRVIALNLTAPMKTMRKAVNQMQKQGTGGSIVNVASAGGIIGGLAGAAYTASKHGLVGLTKNTAIMYPEFNIRCNVVCPGGINTPMGSPENAKNFSKFGMERITRGLGRMSGSSEPEDIANVILLLASDEAVAINGAVVSADLGLTAY